MDQPAVAVGRITGAHGIKGEVSLLVLSEVQDRFAPGAVVFLEDGRRLTVATSRRHRAGLLVTFEEVPDRTAAERMARHMLFVPESMSPPLPEGSWWDHQLVGCAVLTDDGRPLGELREVIHTAANDVWSAVDEGGRETLIPALRDVIVSVDVSSKRVVVRPVPGLTVPEA
ncbi:MAG TPA: ribosome maturation factor RimM [Actinomycetota bacterium]